MCKINLHFIATIVMHVIKLISVISYIYTCISALYQPSVTLLYRKSVAASVLKNKQNNIG